MGTQKLLVIFFPLIYSNLFRLSTAVDTITPNQSLVDGQTLVSSGGAFELGFFSPGDSKNRYLGIWYKRVPVQKVAWVANRESPITTSTGVLHLTADGNLTLHAHSAGDVLWSTATSAVSNPIVQLLDSGNLVVNDSETSVWQSFDHPSDTLFPGMKFGWDLRTKFERRLTSWTSPSDPSPGAFTLAVDLRGSPEVYTLNGSAPTCRSGPWDGQSWGGAASMKKNAVFSYQFVSTPDEIYYSYEITDNSVISMLVLNQQGILQQLVWLSGEWRTNWFVPRDQCDSYAQCGAFGVCTSGDAELCKCLTGFVPKSPEEWNLRDASDGCVRRTALSCRGGDGFLKAAGVKLPDTANATVDEAKGFDECRDGCLMNCACVAFAFLSGASGCLTWHGKLIDIRAFSQGGGDDLYLRLAASELDAGSKRKVLVIVVVTASLALLIFSTVVYFVWMRRRRHKGIREVSMEDQSLFTLGNDMTIKLGESTDLNSEFSLFHFSNLVYATDNFSGANKLGEGGFGSVYKGRLLKGQEIAVKRLEAHSGQGAEEFKNEIILIAKLQHRNLVKLLGCCVEGEEKILIYEYLPNKSLDFLLFDPIRGAELNWGRRIHIIEGIAQGLLYLHKHSRLRIIHRDLKASNILLDADMNPKISDFGMARIFGSNEVQTRTKRVVGTYGYMSPEYTLEGLFSIKSDVFSFGVILLEIISGKRNCGFRHYGDSLNLLGYAWKLWKETKWQELVDPLLDGKYSMSEVSRCIHVALMCVQESAIDRPTMSDVITMLGSESIDLPNPKQPGFFNVRIVTKLDLPSESEEAYSQNEVTITITDGR